MPSGPNPVTIDGESAMCDVLRLTEGCGQHFIVLSVLQRRMSRHTSNACRNAHAVDLATSVQLTPWHHTSHVATVLGVRLVVGAELQRMVHVRRLPPISLILRHPRVWFRDMRAMHHATPAQRIMHIGFCDVQMDRCIYVIFGLCFGRGVLRASVQSHPGPIASVGKFCD